MSFASHLKAATPGPFSVDLSRVKNPEGFTVTKEDDTHLKGVVAARWNFSLVTANSPYLNLRIISGGGTQMDCDVHPKNVVKVLSKITADISEGKFWTLCDD